MYAIESKENFKLEVEALLERIRQKINASSSYVSAYNKKPNKITTAKFNVLKVQEFRMKDALAWLGLMSEKEWANNKIDLQKDFKAANEALNSVTDLK